MKIAIVIGRVLLGMGFIVFGLNILYPFMTSPPPPEGSLAAQFVGVMVPTHWIGLVGVLQLSGWLTCGNWSDRANGPGFAWTYSR
jgi:putative oxidoreductase